ncbi:flippase [Chryseobacterium sp. YIM B08800]|uniref:flippase n=1 Tax=Chryseobacterium sp. YIM B08800 TaxID=2984136 RepID=UPI0022404BBF|nr:flippase [Chryseobacterium sp. YIM B08800]
MQINSKISKEPNIKINFILNVLRVLSAVILGIVTMPYLNRVLGVEYIGKVEYVYTIINYFVLFSALGIPMYGIREVSKNRHNNKELYKIVLELLIILFITTIISYFIIFAVILQLSFFNDYKNLIITMTGMVFLNNVGLEWYFQGIEKQGFVTIRSLIIRSLTIFLIFHLINAPTDYKSYGFLIAVFSFSANILNFIFVGNKILKEKIPFRSIRLKRHIKPILTIFVATISVTIYVQLDNFLIGFFYGDKYVGYYSLANKLIRNSIVLITIIGAVTLPRLSYLYTNNIEEYNKYLLKTLNVLFILSLPFSSYFFLFSKGIVNIMGGVEFEQTILTIKILSPLCIIVSFAYFLGFLILYPQGKESLYTKATIYSAVFSVIINLFIIKLFKHNGAAFTAVFVEILAIIVMLYYIKKRKLVKKIMSENLKKIFLINSGLLLLFLFILNFFAFNQSDIFLFFAASSSFFIVYFLTLLISKEEITIELFSRYVIKNKS